MILDVDDDGGGTMKYEEFLQMMTHKIFNRDPKDEIMKAFRLFDDDETGKISSAAFAHTPASVLPIVLSRVR